ncbi:hypothetical protein LJC02_01895 [Breznakia sp. OttesenSCG-928-G09]|nr:hypothetical protein [Breznakia sp. OttesenSCG-928-G09]
MIDKPIIKSVRDYILTFTGLVDEAKVNVGYLPKETINFSIEEIPNEQGSIVRKYLDGGSERQFLFVFAAMFNYEEATKTMIENSGFFEEFQEWIEKNDVEEIYPKLRSGLKPTGIEVLTTGYLFYVPESMDRARYQIQCRLTYEKEAI